MALKLAKLLPLEGLGELDLRAKQPLRSETRVSGYYIQRPFMVGAANGKSPLLVPVCNRRT